MIVAAGRAGRIGDEYRGPGEGGACGFSYAARMYRAREGTEPPTSALPMSAMYQGYQAMVFPQDDRTHSALVVRPTSRIELGLLRHNEGFAAAARAIPLLAPWTDPERFEPITAVMAGSGLSNTYRGQTDPTKGAAGLFFVGDAVSTTNPAAGRGVSLGLRQAAELVRLLRGAATDYPGTSQQFGSWCMANIHPWYKDHVFWDANLLARFRGEDINIEGPLSSDVICAAANRDPGIWRAAGPFMAMRLPPSSLKAVEEDARAVLRTGWRPPYEAGPTTEQLADILQNANVTALANRGTGPRLVAACLRSTSKPGHGRPEGLRPWQRLGLRVAALDDARRPFSDQVQPELVVVGQYVQLARSHRFDHSVGHQRRVHGRRRSNAALPAWSPRWPA